MRASAAGSIAAPHFTMVLTTSTVAVPSPLRASAEGATHRYRPDIDGLRALAVVLVVIYHAVPTVLAGGFAGVDVFFVISGYLITSIIWRETRDGTFTLAHFYARRCRRILPALFVVLAATWAIGRMVLAPDDFRLLARHIIGGATFTSNILLWGETGYFDIAAVRKPLLHLWSLGVEEQFYAVWPPLVMLAATRHWRPLRLTVAILGVSLILAVGLAAAHPNLVFYLLPTRMWELLIGALLVAGSDDTGFSARLGGASDVKAIAGMLLIAATCVVDPGHGRAHIAWLAAPVCGAALLISAGDAWINRRILSHPLLVGIGLISYPLYLWHWPLLSVTTLLSEHHGRPQLSLLKATAIVTACSLAWLTWRFVELPIRRLAAEPSNTRGLRDWHVLRISGALLLIVGAIGWLSQRAVPAADSVATADATEPLRDADTVYQGAAFRRYSGASNVVLLVGDSHANHLIEGLLPVARAHGFGLSHIGIGGCLGISLDERLWGTPELFARCQSMADATLSYFLRDPAVKIVLFAARGELYADGTEAGFIVAPEHHTALPLARRRSVLHDAYASAIRRAEEAGKHVVLTLDIPELDYDPEYCGDERAVAGPAPPCTIARRVVDERQRTYRSVVGSLQQEHPNLRVFDPLPLLCDDAWCYAKRNGLLLYKGDNHLSADGSRLVAKRLGDLVFASTQN